ncbi:molybdopterin cofactor-binding domain-containing protein [Azorhizobium sp. AG788]|uniref:xanthine dehydrogenase family protein molybdopterin-binding subunit n=1 Tax=Azorhizobium sp. AG788 TaxID=2183897 RepID=UPI003138C8C6
MIANTLPASLSQNPRLDHWLDFSEPGHVTVRTGKVELGQGILTALAQIAADELDVPMARLRLVSGDTRTAPAEGYTAGSLSIQQSGGAIRLVCAEVRAKVLDAAAAQLGCPSAALTLSAGAVMRGDSPTGLDYWSIAPRLDLTGDATGSAPVKAHGELRVVGTDVPRLDLPAKIGGAPFIHDLAPAGLRHARMLHPPRWGALLTRLDTAVLQRHPGVELIRHGHLAAVLGDDELAVAAAAEALKARAIWTGGAVPADGLDEAASLRNMPTDITRRDIGTPGTVTRRFSAAYSRPYLAHGSIAPSCALAQWSADRLTVWTHSQGVTLLRGALATALRLSPAQVDVIHHQGAGCYGHNGADDAAFDAAVIALQRPDVPVRLLWSRADEMTAAPFGAAMVVQVDAGLDADFRPTEWTLNIWSASHARRPGINGAVHLNGAAALPEPILDPLAPDLPDAAGGGANRNAVALYDFPHQRIVQHFVAQPPVRTSSMRGLGAFANTLAIEGAMDEAAELAGMDPVTYRLRHMSDPRARAVIEAAARMSGWFEGADGNGRAKGFAFGRYKNVAAYVGLVAEVEVDEAPRLTRVWCAVDAGLVINPDGARNQVEGGIIQGASWALKEQVRFAEGAIATADWDSYPILRFSEIPDIETRFIGDPRSPALGIGEVTQGPIGAAICNAVARALGARVRDLPLTGERIAAALLAEG